MLQLGSFLTFSCFCLVFVLDGFWGLTLSLGLMMMFWTAVLPQLEVLTLNCIQGNTTGYSRIRLWGSIGFILLTALVGKLLDLFGTEVPVYASTAVLLGIFLASLTLREPRVKATLSTQSGSILEKVKGRPFLLFISSAILLQFSFGTYYGFFALYMRDLGYNGQQIGLLIALGVLAEIGIFLLAGRLISRFGVKLVLIGCMLLTALRWYLLADLPHAELMIILSQCLHAFSFGLTHSASMNFIHTYFGSDFQSRGQALYISLSFGLGGAIGNYMAGNLWLQGKGAYAAFALSALIALLGGAVLLPFHSEKSK